MERILVNGVPLSEAINAADGSDLLELEPEKKQKFVMVCGNQELHITACAVSKLAGIHSLPDIEGYGNYFVEPNQKWLEDSGNERAWVKIYCKLNPETNSKIEDRIQTVKIPMPFLGESSKECWAEIQLMIKKQVIRDGHSVNLNAVKLGRHKCYDTRVGEWVPETKPIVPKKDAGTHGYVALRLYHQNFLLENQPDWRFEPLFAAIADKDFYQIDANWQNEEIVITVTLLSDNSPEIPKFLRQ